MNKQSAAKLAEKLAHTAIEKRAGGMEQMLQGLRGVDLDSIKSWFMGLPPEARNAILGSLIGGVGSGGLSAITGGSAGKDALLGALLGGLAGGGGTYAKRTLLDDGTVSSNSLSDEEIAALNTAVGAGSNDVANLTYDTATGAVKGLALGGIAGELGNMAKERFTWLDTIEDLGAEADKKWDDVRGKLDIVKKKFPVENADGIQIKDKRGKPMTREGWGLPDDFTTNRRKFESVATASEARKRVNQMSAWQKIKTSLFGRGRFEREVDKAVANTLNAEYKKLSPGLTPVPEFGFVYRYRPFGRKFVNLKGKRFGGKYWPYVLGAGAVLGGAHAFNKSWPWE